MSTTQGRLSGTEWQEWANQLLTCHYGPAEYQRIPDKDRGDAGIEGYTYSGHVYQAYGCEEPISVADRYTRQRKKLTDDITKFIQNKSQLTSVLGNVKVTRWILLVPLYDSKELVVHANKKTQEVIAQALPYVAPAFFVKISDESDFLIEREKLLHYSLQGVQFVTGHAPAAAVADWSQGNNGLVDILQAKLKKLPALKSVAEQEKFRDAVLGWYLDGQRTMDELRQHPTMYEAVIRATAHCERYLAMHSLALGGNSNPASTLENALKDLRATIGKEVRQLHQFDTHRLAQGTAADWLIRCPLDFS